MKERAVAAKTERERVRACEAYICVQSGFTQCGLALGERLGATLKATTGLLEVIIVNANTKQCYKHNTAGNKYTMLNMNDSGKSWRRGSRDSSVGWSIALVQTEISNKPLDEIP